MRTLVSAALAVLLALVTTASANEPAAGPRYAVVSLVGNQIQVVGAKRVIGTSVDRNDKQLMPIDSDVFDKTALLATDREIKALQPKITPILLAPRDPRLFSLQDGKVDEAGVSRELLELLKPTLLQQGATHLVLFTRFRDQARMQLSNTALGHGKVEGLGFYIDRMHDTVEQTTGVGGTGFLGAYVYLKASLVDVSTLEVLREAVSKQTRVVTVGRAADGSDPWQTMTAAQKVNELRRLVSSAVEEAVPKVIAGR